jgi:predicted nicotinamide N-methyase
VPGAAAPYVITLPTNPDGVLDELVEPLTHMPYWATVWPSGLALAEAVLARREAVVGRSVLELGCGLGITATAVQDAGGRITAADCFAEALAYTRLNVLRNTDRAPRTLLADWRSEAGRAVLLRGSASLVLAADVLYEGEDVAPLLELGGELLRRGCALWLAEPGRATSERFVSQARTAGWRGETLERERLWPAGAGPAHVRVHFFESAG